jgi:hypothetical protein
VRASKAGAETRADGEAGAEAEAEADGAVAYTGAVGAVGDEQANHSELTAVRLSGTKRRAAADRRPTTWPRYFGSGFECREDGGAKPGRLGCPCCARVFRDRSAEGRTRVNGDFVVRHRR